MLPSQISDLLAPFLDRPLSPAQLDQVSTYLDLLLRWNSRINLTAIRRPEEIIPRHFGESFFLARHLLPACVERTFLSARLKQDESLATSHWPLATVLDIGSGAGFPALPLKIFEPEIHLTLIESNHKKSAFLREVIRALSLSNVTVITDRAEKVRAENVRAQNIRAEDAHTETLTARSQTVDNNSSERLSPDARAAAPEGRQHRENRIGQRESLRRGSEEEAGTRKVNNGEKHQFDVVTFRAVEKFDAILPIAASFLSRSGTLALLIGASQVAALQSLPAVSWSDPIYIPQSHQRIIALGSRKS